MSDSDDDIPPLDGMAEQLGALRVKDSSAPQAPSSIDPGGSLLPVATATVAQQTVQDRAPRPKPAIKRGFFDAKPTRRKAKDRAASEDAGQAVEDIPVLKAKSQGLSGKHIPDFLRVEPDEEDKKLQEMKEGLMNALKPTEETVQGVMKNPDLLAGFDDPEVMAAVDEIAKNPQAMKKYQGNRKVRKFYEAMGMYVGTQLEGKEADKSAS